MENLIKVTHTVKVLFMKIQNMQEVKYGTHFNSRR